MKQKYEVSIKFGAAEHEVETENPPEFERFEELSTKLLAVPKQEVDEQREKP